MKFDWMKRLLYLFPILSLWAVIEYVSRVYSPVPYFDTWDGGVVIIQKIMEGDWWYIFSPHNEHRIALTRILFVLDKNLFGSHFSFLVALNIFFALVSFVVFSWISFKWLKRNDIVFLCFLGCFITLLSQAENFRWEFQSQFFLAYVLPLMSFLFFSGALNEKMEVESNRNLYFSISLAFISLFSMGNGFLASLIILALVFYFKCNVRQRLIVVLVSGFSFVYTVLGAVGNTGGAFNNGMEPVEIALFFLGYLGSPFYHLAKILGASLHISILFGALFVSLFVFCIVAGYRNRCLINKYSLILYCFLSYVFFTAGLTALSRFGGGLLQSTSERYTTPAVMGWIALLLLIYPVSKSVDRFLKLMLIALIMMMTSYQMREKDKIPPYITSRDAFMVSRFLGVTDRENMKILHPSPERIDFAVAQIKNETSFFTNSKSYRDMQMAFTRMYDFGDYPPAAECQINFDAVRVIPDSDYQYMNGWFKYAPYDKNRHFFLVFNERYEKIGYMALGHSRQDVSDHFSDRKTNVGFQGYFAKEAMIVGEKLYFYSPETGFYCSHIVHNME